MSTESSETTKAELKGFTQTVETTMNPSVHKLVEETASISATQNIVVRGEKKRQRAMSQKALENAIQAKIGELHANEKTLKKAIGMQIKI